MVLVGVIDGVTVLVGVFVGVLVGVTVVVGVGVGVGHVPEVDSSILPVAIEPNQIAGLSDIG
jgi:hypothetical protein